MKRRDFGRLGLLLGASAFLPAVASCREALIVSRAHAEPDVQTPSQAQKSRALNNDFEIVGKIIYVKKGDIWRYSDGKTKQLSRGNRYETPAFSPDGKRIASSFMGENHSDLMILDSEGGKVLQLTKNWSPASIQDQSWARKPAWSPDGKKIAFISDLGANDMSLFMIDAEGSTPRRMVTGVSFTGGVDWPTWAPNGKSVAYIRFENAPAYIESVDLTSFTTETLANAPEGAYDPTISPDGLWLAYVIRVNGSHDIYLKSLESEVVFRLTETGASRAPCWSPDGKALAYLTNQNDCFDIQALKLDLAAAPLISEPKTITKSESVEAPSGLSWTN